MRFGAHMSVAGGFHEAVRRGARAGCDVIQVFTTAPGSWRRKRAIPRDVRLLKAAAAECGVEIVAAHAIYLINIASPKRVLYNKSIEALIAEVETCSLLGIPYIVLHPGSGGNDDRAGAIDRIAQALNRVLAKTKDSTVTILLETTAGAGWTVGRTFRELAAIRKKVAQKKRIAYCLDTCHLFTAGYDFRTKRSYAATVRALERQLGLRNVRLFHMNDSKYEYGSRKDRHEHIGRGTIGRTGFGFFARDRRFLDVPAVLETPKSEDLKEDRRNLAVLRKLEKAMPR